VGGRAGSYRLSDVAQSGPWTSPTSTHPRLERLEIGRSCWSNARTPEPGEKWLKLKLNGSDAALAARAQEKCQKQRKNGSAIAWDDSGWRKSKKLEREQLESGKNQNPGGIAIGGGRAGRARACPGACASSGGRLRGAPVISPDSSAPAPSLGGLRRRPPCPCRQL
jgi:hypothetical protein